MKDSLVSILMPFYNSSSTLPWAVASVLEQRYENWELIAVDDGSTDKSFDMLESIDDSRIRLARLEKNFGRGVARQVTLDMALGEYACFLDADDWMYPDRIEIQVAMLDSERRLAVVSCGVARVDEMNRMYGVFGVGDASMRGPFQSLRVPFSFPASMIRMEIVDSACFNADYLRGQDADFVDQILWGRYYSVAEQVLYAFRRPAHVNVAAKLAYSHRFRRARLRAKLSRRPIEGIYLLADSMIKEAIWKVAADRESLSSALLNRDVKSPSEEESSRFVRAREMVEIRAQEIAKTLG